MVKLSKSCKKVETIHHNKVPAVSIVILAPFTLILELRFGHMGRLGVHFYKRDVTYKFLILYSHVVWVKLVHDVYFSEVRT